MTCSGKSLKNLIAYTADCPIFLPEHVNGAFCLWLFIMANYQKPGIYLIRNIVNGKVYIGSAINIYKRKLEHFYRLRLDKHENQKLQYSWNKHGEDAFEHKVLILCDIESLIHYEQCVIDLYQRRIGTQNLYNINLTAGSRLGIKHSEETKRKISAAKQNVSLETRQKISEANKGNKYWLGRKHSIEARKKMSKSKKGKPSPRKGVTLSDETKAKISANSVANRPDVRAKNSAAHKGLSNNWLGRKHTNETKRKMSLAKIGKPSNRNIYKRTIRENPDQLELYSEDKNASE